VAFGYTSEPYHRLVEKDRRVERLFTYVPCTADPGLFSVTARLKNTEDLPYVRDIILQGFWRAWATVRPRELGDAKANAYYRTARGFDGTESIAAVVSRFVGYRRSYATLNDYYRRYRAVTPDLLNEVATRYLTEDGLVITTVSHEAGHANLSVSRAADLQKTTAGSINVSVRPSTLPQLHVKLVFDAGSAYDPPGKEGLAALTASMIAQGGSLSQRYEEIKRGLLPIAGHFQVQADKEQVSFSGSIHSDNWECFLDLVLPMLLEPALRDEDFARVLDNQRRALAEDLRFNNDEELCRERLQTNVFTGTPYGHPTLGTLSGLDSVSLEDVRTHITSFYTRANLMVAATGALPAGLIGCLQQELGVLPEGRPPSRPEVSWLPSRALTVEIIEKPTNATTLCLGHAIEVTRAHPDFAPLWLAASWLGDHRSVVGRLFRRIRQARGLNYGAYAYIEAFPQAMFRLSPAAHSVRRAQIFEIWIRPVAPENTVMALKIALHELDDLIERGLSVESFETTKRYLLKTAPLLQGLQEQALGATMDSQWYGNRDATMAERLRALSVEDVNAAIRRHLSAKDLSVVITARDGAGLKEALLTERPSSLSYPEQKPIELLEEDQRIGSRRLHLTPEAITVTPAETVFD
jgi:zinc protease